MLQRILITALVSYFLGNHNGAICVSAMLHDDVRSHGSGNAGLTNFIRSYGAGRSAMVIAIDVGKAVLACLLGALVFEPYGLRLEGMTLAGACVMLGHDFPALQGFRGGKGILSGGTIAIMIDWRIAVVVWGGFLILTALTRYVSLGSLWAGASFPFISWYCYPQTPIIVLAFCLGGLIVWKHRANIQRLLAGNENKLSFHRKKT